MEGTGFRPDHYVADDVVLWPENSNAWAAFTLLQGQWRCGPSGPIGLDYGVVFPELDRMGLTGEDRSDTIDALRVIEIAAMQKLTEG